MIDEALPGRVGATDDVGGHRRLLLAVVASALCVLAAVAVFGLLVDPFGAMGTGLVKPIFVSPVNDQSKVRALAPQRNPDFLIVGTSRVRQYDPQVLAQGTQLRGFNAGIGGGDVLDGLLYARWLSHRDPKGGPRLPHLVIGVDAEEFQRSAANKDALNVPQLRAQLSTRERITAQIAHQWAPLVQWQTFEYAVRALVRTARGDVPNLAVPGFDQFGMRPSSPTPPPGAQRDAVVTQRRPVFDETYRQYLSFYATRRDVNRASVRQLEQLIALANRLGDTPTVLLTPMYPDLAALLDGRGRGDRRAALLDALAQMHTHLRFLLVDDAHALDRHRALSDWLDPVHPTQQTAGELMRALRVRDAFFARARASASGGAGSNGAL